VRYILDTRAAHTDVDGRDKPGHDGTGAFCKPNLASCAYPSAYGFSDRGYSRISARRR
jgi:hypothetical protein